MSEAFKAQMNEYVSFINDHLATYFADASQPQQELFSAMRYSLLSGGKRLRGIMVLAFARLCGGDWQKAAPYAAALEMIQAYSLIHDDLPCMDDDDFRRGAPTNHKVYGEAMAVLAGDALLTAAFHTVATAPFDCNAKAVEVLAVCAGELGMVGGQALDIRSEDRACTEQEILDIQTRKTGALIKAACLLGVLAGGGNLEQMQAAASYAEHLGLAFQIRDDMLDVIGDAKVLGKATGVDAEKNTFVRLYGLERCQELVLEHTDKALEAVRVFPNPDFVEELARSLTQRVA